MARRIVCTQNAISDFQRLIKYLKIEWSMNSAIDFEKKLFFRIGLISNFPNLGKPSVKSPKIRKTLITKHNSLYYLVEKKKSFC